MINLLTDIFSSISLEFKRIIFYCLLSTLSFSLPHQNLKFERLDAQNGLSQNFGTTIIQDKYGFIWIGTQDGLNRYNGYNFTIYNHGKDESDLTSNFILSSFIDSKKNLWIGTKYGLNKIIHSSNTFKKILISSTNDITVKQNSIWAICEDKFGNIWLGTQDGLFKLDPSSGKFTEFKKIPSSNKSLSNNFITALTPDSFGNLWIATKGGGLNKLDLTTHTFTVLSTKQNPNLKSNYLTSLFYSQNDPHKLLVGTDKGLNIYDLNKKLFVKPAVSNNLFSKHITAIKKDSKDLYWIGTNSNGLFSFDDKKQKIIEFKFDPTDITSINSSRVTSLFVDKSDLIWIGTPKGINKLKQQKKFFNTYKLPEEHPELIFNNNIFPVIENKKGILWLGSDGGLNKFDRNKNKSVIYQHIPENKNSLSDNLVRAIVQDEEGNIWIGNYNGVDKFSPKTQKFTHFLQDKQSTKIKIVYLLNDKKGSIWAASDGNGLFRINKKNGEIKNYRHTPGDTIGLSTDHIYPIILGRNNEIWIGTYYGGVLKYNFDNDQITRLSTTNEYLKPFNNCSSMAIYQDSSYVLWIGSYGNGLYKYNLNNNLLKQYTIDDGLANNVIYGILEDNNKNLWLSTNNGLSKFNIKAETFRNFTTKDGLLSNEFNGNGCFKSSSGEMFFTGINGLISFFPENLDDNKTEANIVFTNINLFGESIPIGEMSDGRTLLSKSLQETKTIMLSHEDFPFSIEYASLDFQNSDQINYAYKMENLNKNWSYVGNRRFVSYNLRPGDYTFKVVTTNKLGVKNKNETTLNIIVIPPFWDTILFKLGIGLLLTVLLFVAYRYRIYNLNRQKTQLELNNKKLNQEISERKRAEEAVKESETKYKTLFTSIADPILIIDKYSNFIVECNQYAIDNFGYSRNELLKMKVFDLHPKEELLLVNNNIKDDAKLGPNYYTYLKKNGSKIFVEVHSEYLIYKNKPAWLSIIRDVTEQINAEKELERLNNSLVLKNKELEDIIYVSSHDLRTPLVNIQGYSQELYFCVKDLMDFLSAKIDESLFPKEFQNIIKQEIPESIDYIKSNALKMDMLLNGLLFLSRESRADYSIQDFNLYNIVESACHSVKHFVNLEKIYNNLNKNTTCKGDPQKLKKVFIEIIKNAFQYSVPNQTPSLYISSKPNDSYLNISFKDNGIGIKKEHQFKIFDIFHRLKPDLSGSLGIGLTIAQRIIFNHNGAIEIESSENNGTTVIVSLPIK